LSPECIGWLVSSIFQIGQRQWAWVSTGAWSERSVGVTHGLHGSPSRLYLALGDGLALKKWGVKTLFRLASTTWSTYRNCLAHAAQRLPVDRAGNRAIHHYLGYVQLDLAQVNGPQNGFL
jgi:hypothetical protein